MKSIIIEICHPHETSWEQFSYSWKISLVEENETKRREKREGEKPTQEQPIDHWLGHSCGLMWRMWSNPASKKTEQHVVEECSNHWFTSYSETSHLSSPFFNPITNRIPLFLMKYNSCFLPQSKDPGSLFYLRAIIKQNGPEPQLL